MKLWVAIFDIEATSPNKISYAIEVKYIGIQDYRYNEIIKSLESDDVGGCFNLYDGYNYILFKAFEAAKQLSAFSSNRLVMIVASSLDWDFLKIPIKDKWIYDRPYGFSPSSSKQWSRFLEGKKKKEKRFSNIEGEIDSVISGLKEWWVLREEERFNFLFEAKI